MTDFLTALTFVLKNEAGFVDNAADSGGATNYGISLRFLRQIPVDRLRKYGIFHCGEALSVEDIKNLTPDQVSMIYKGEFWDHAPFGSIEDYKLRNFVFDCCIQHGISQGIKLLQRALWAYDETKFVVNDDGILGENTLSLMNGANEIILLKILRAERAGLMRLLAIEYPKNREFLDGWLNRCYRS